MHDVYKKIIENNKEFINYIYMLFIYCYKIELKKEIINNISESYAEKVNNFNNNISESGFKILKNKNISSGIRSFNIHSKDSINYNISLDYNSEIWSFDINIKKENNIKLKECYRGFYSAGIYLVSEDSSFLITEYYPEQIVLTNKDINEEIEFIKLNHDVDLSSLDLSDFYFENVGCLAFIRELK